MSWKKGIVHEKRVKRLIENGTYDGLEYKCIRFPKQKFYTQDYYGADIICVNAKHWLLCQVKYQSQRKPALTKKLKDALLEHIKPDCTKHVVARIDGRDEKVYWDEL